jgi:NADH-quinone oxidoreductase subunit A
MLWPLLVYAALAIALAASMILISYVLGERHQERATGEPYESGILSTGTARLRVSAKFYLLAMFFVVFDLEAAFLFAWAIAFRELGWAGYVEILIFITILLAALAYLWRLGALDWGPTARGTRREQV